MGHGRVFALYVAMYCVARGLIETMRIDDARLILGIRLNVFTALIVGAGALLYLVRSSEKNPGREILSRGKLVLKSIDQGTTQETTELTEPVFAPESIDEKLKIYSAQPLALDDTRPLIEQAPQPPTTRSNQPGRRRKT